MNLWLGKIFSVFLWFIYVYFNGGNALINCIVKTKMKRLPKRCKLDHNNNADIWLSDIDLQIINVSILFNSNKICILLYYNKLDAKQCYKPLTIFLKHLLTRFEHIFYFHKKKKRACMRYTGSPHKQAWGGLCGFVLIKIKTNWDPGQR